MILLSGKYQFLKVVIVDYLVMTDPLWNRRAVYLWSPPHYFTAIRLSSYELF